ATKGDGITRDIDVLRCMREHVPVLCKVTVTTTDAALAARVEPNAPSPARRLEAVARLAEAGLFAGVLLMPVLPFLEDNVENVRAVVEAAAEAGARFVYPAFGMTLRDQQREYYYQALKRLSRPGERYRRQYGLRYMRPQPTGKGPGRPGGAVPRPGPAVPDGTSPPPISALRERQLTFF
ncbi:MAG: radical SAM protein, partial [Flavonifractor plautii]